MKVGSKNVLLKKYKTGGTMIEYTVPHDADVIIVDGIRVSRVFFQL